MRSFVPVGACVTRGAGHCRATDSPARRRELRGRTRGGCGIVPGSPTRRGLRSLPGTGESPVSVNARQGSPRDRSSRRREARRPPRSGCRARRPLRSGDDETGAESTPAPSVLRGSPQVHAIGLRRPGASAASGRCHRGGQSAGRSTFGSNSPHQSSGSTYGHRSACLSTIFGGYRRHCPEFRLLHQ